MRLGKKILIFNIFISIFIFLYSWIMDKPLFKVKYGTVYSSQSTFSNLKVNEKYEFLVSPKNEFIEKNNSVQSFHIRDSFYKCLTPDCVVLAVSCCGKERLMETYTMIKSVIVLSKCPIVIEVFTDEIMVSFFETKAHSWPEIVKERVKLNLHPAKYPPGFPEDKWRNMFATCASLRLFFPSILKDVDSLIYVDADSVFLSPIEDLWVHFRKMNSSHIAALVSEHEDTATGWYNRFAMVPYYGKLGLNSGVMLMNLTRLRRFGWEEYLEPLEKEFHSKLTYGDQDIINIIFHYHPDKLYLLGCEYNYRPDHCMYTNTCKSLKDRGVYVLHGSRRVFETEKQPVFKAVFEAWNKFEFGDHLRQNFYYPLVKYFVQQSKSKSSCAKLRKEFLKNIEKLIVL